MDRILVVEDDRELNQGICFALQQAGYETESAYSTQEAKLAGLQQEYSLMILDVLLRLLNIAIFNSHIFQYISACYA